MNLLGKILVVVVFIAALLLGAMVILLNTRTTNWPQAHNEMERRYKAALAQEQVAIADRKKAEHERQEALKDVALVKKEMQIKENEFKTKFDIQAKKNQEDRKQLDQGNATVSEAVISMAIYQKDIKGMQKRVDDLLADLQNHIKEKEELKNAKVIAEITTKALTVRLAAMEKQMKELIAELERRTAVIAGNPPQQPKPLHNVEGLISNTDERFATITIGSDVGVVKGQTFYVFRLDPRQPKSLGTITILDVRPHESVGELDKRIPPGTVRRGDRVGTSIINGSL